MESIKWVLSLIAAVIIVMVVMAVWGILVAIAYTIAAFVAVAGAVLLFAAVIKNQLRKKRQRASRPLSKLREDS